MTRLPSFHALRIRAIGITHIDTHHVDFISETSAIHGKHISKTPTPLASDPSPVECAFFPFRHQVERLTSGSLIHLRRVVESFEQVRHDMRMPFQQSQSVIVEFPISDVTHTASRFSIVRLHHPVLTSQLRQYAFDALMQSNYSGAISINLRSVIKRFYQSVKSHVSNQQPSERPTADALA
jgi:hypothetical protein